MKFKLGNKNEMKGKWILVDCNKISCVIWNLTQLDTRETPLNSIRETQLTMKVSQSAIFTKLQIVLIDHKLD